MTIERLIPPQYRVATAAIGIALLIAALVAGYLGWRSHQRGIGAGIERAAWEVAIDQQKQEAARMLAEETAKVTATEKELRAWKDAQEVEDARNQKYVANLSARLRDLAGPAGRLRDPNAGRGSGSGAAQGGDPPTAGDCAGDGAEAGGLLSRPLSELFRNVAVEADEINLAYIACREDAKSLRAVMNKERD